MTAPAPEETRRETLRPRAKHAHCPGCFPNLATGATVPTLCGGSKRFGPGATVSPPPDACVVCLDLVTIPCEICGWHW